MQPPPPRHACSGCGACCEGAVVHLLPGEAPRVDDFGARLAIADPVVDGRLRQVDGRCAFLDPAQRCRIHAAFGADAKPLVCRQFPFVRIDADGAVREGVDPASHAWWATRRGGPTLVPPQGVPIRPAPLPPDQQRTEAAVLHALAAPGLTLGDLVRTLTGSPPGPGVPRALAVRWLHLLARAPLIPLLDRPEVGPLHRASLRPALVALTALGAPPSPLPSAPDPALAVDLVREMLYLRLVSRSPAVIATALVLALGLESLAWTSPDPMAWRRAASTWCRTVRAGPFLGALLPSPEALRWLAIGDAGAMGRDGA